jgi:phage terminase large subunit
MATDLGYTDSTAMWFWQPRPDGLAIIDYYENHSQPLQHYFDFLDSTGYEFDTLWLPHDARARTLQTGRSTVEQFIDKYKDSPVRIDIVPMLKKQHGIDAARLVLPQCYFDLDNTKGGIETLRSYRRKYDAVKNVFSNEPLHDWASNGADAFRYLSLVCKERLKVDIISDKIITPVIQPHGESYNLNDLFAERDRFMKRRRARI